jgi:acyl-CoA reductase-like NAD-dependent aldehyde dehydrogenase
MHKDIVLLPWASRVLWLLLLLQVREHKTALANYETQDMGKPIDEAEWDMVSAMRVGGGWG